jgi:hypothetical protein
MERALEDIKQYKVTRKFFHNNRWFVAIKGTFNGKKRMPHANYVWLLNNPAFEDVPPGYVIHHLDADSCNDDPTNLVLMKKHLHTAYHMKHINNGEANEKIRLRSPVGIGTNLTIPRITQAVQSGRSPIWRFRWTETGPSGKRVTRDIRRIGNKIFRTEQEAEKARQLFMKIHPSYKSKEDREKIYSLIQEINQDIDVDELDDAYELVKKTFPSI